MAGQEEPTLVWAFWHLPPPSSTHARCTAAILRFTACSARQRLECHIHLAPERPCSLLWRGCGSGCSDSWVASRWTRRPLSVLRAVPLGAIGPGAPGHREHVPVIYSPSSPTRAAREAAFKAASSVASQQCPGPSSAVGHLGTVLFLGEKNSAALCLGLEFCGTAPPAHSGLDLSGP
ncbi:hypothetical protein P7K49_030963 [Saguinus oedipus]|uniref:Uncharacterized protein n=1 Tax=Saguinus oedipus TaxID=9490 RepID=A0ABQ9U3P6_SAGOE|nr:hypothetical protein P7K49_030963 [Saguinus oedipus]